MIKLTLLRYFKCFLKRIKYFVAWNHFLLLIIFNNLLIHDTIALSFSVSISTSCISIISISANWIKSVSISSNFRPNDVIGSAPDFTWNSNWSTWKSFNSFPSRLLENPAAFHVKFCMKSRIRMDMLWWNSNK